ncbi:cupredoxin domain-containing protein [Saccharothrix luteola]|uniref:cupredoxin domain-containing protein n=1 Tax=Saccharothrix luteola TaxID=2893018 RepID=UPI001E5DDCEF|nr:cupredoxin domain-containing protein [Saccharothrix luteola]MCC8250425.1 cupredoxin domain-containing protein [Saccharothrix luteola]
MSAPALERRTSSPATALTASAVLAVANAITFLVLAGRPNPGMAALSVLPLAAAALLWRRVQVAPVVTIAVAALVVFIRPVDLAFDLVRPGDVLPFAVAAVLVTAAGVAIVSSLVLVLRPSTGTGERLVGLGGGTAVGVALAATLLVVWPQSDDTGSLTDEQLAALPTVDMTNFKFSPAQLRVGRGQPVAFKFTNDTDDNHTFTITELGVDIEVPSGRTRIAVVDARPGQYAVHCAAGDHQEKGMVGRLTVTEDALTSTAAPETSSGAHHHG